jgi:hypothetical protein
VLQANPSDAGVGKERPKFAALRSIRAARICSLVIDSDESMH